MANTSSVTKTTNNYQILNISNVNAQNEVVLNDEQLLQLIMGYPFLYNPHVRPANDPDYEHWAWQQIAKSFNRLYDKLNRNVLYTPVELMDRWKVLQPIVRSLAKVSNSKSLPESLRQTIVKISVPMEEKPNESVKKTLTPAQKAILDYMPFVNDLPLVHRKSLEAEMMELILNSELESKATIKLWPNDLEAIDKECDEIADELKFNELDMMDAEINPVATMTIKLHESGQNVQVNSRVTNKIAAELNNYCVSIPKIKSEPEESLLKPMEKNSKWVPLHYWPNYVRKCRVRVKRCVLEDEIPLAQIKREKRDSFRLQI